MGKSLSARISMAKDAFKVDDAEGEITAGSGPIGRFQTTLAAYTPIQDAISSGSANFTFAEIWGSVGNVISTQPSLKFWAGNRYYRRHDIHLNDFFFSNMSGTGGGFEDLKLREWQARVGLDRHSGKQRRK